MHFFTTGEWLRICLTGALVTAVIMVAYDRSLGDGRDVPHARAMALVALSVALVQIPALATALHLTPLHVDDWVIAVAGGLVAAAPLMLGRGSARTRTEQAVPFLRRAA